MVVDDEGFSYPLVDKGRCIKCGQCELRCPVLAEKKNNNSNNAIKPRSYGLKNKNDAERRDSSSGGAFTVFANEIFRQNGVVYGCTLDERQQAKHIRIDKKADLKKLRKSKYVQSNIEGIYSLVKKDLNHNRRVLFVGTPCQAAGLCSFLGKIPDNLLIIDFICHGVPSQKILDLYIASLEERQNSRVRKFYFRNKDKGWHQSGLQMGTSIVYENGKAERKAPAFSDAYMNGFLGDLYLRPSCYECAFKKVPKYYSDITIADFWGIGKIDKEFDDKKGTSLVIVNSRKGYNLFNSIKEQAITKQYNFELSVRKNPPLTHSVTVNPDRQRFYDTLHREGFEKARKKYLTAHRWVWHKISHMLWKKS